METRKCCSCKETKAISEFYKDKPNGKKRCMCMECEKENSREYYYDHVQKVIDRVSEYRKKNHVKRNGRVPDEIQIKAHRVLNNAVNKGEITKPERCEWCERKRKLNGHHWNGYENPLDVLWLCSACHHFAHRRGPVARRLQEYWTKQGEDYGFTP